MNYKIIEKDYGIIVKLIDSFTFRDHDTFFEIVKYIKTNHPNVTVVNMEDCEFIDSAALGMLVILSDEIKGFDGDHVIVNLFKKVSNILYAARFDSLYDIVKSKETLSETEIDKYVHKTYRMAKVKNKNTKKEVVKLEQEELPELIMDEDGCVRVNGKKYKVVRQEELDLDLDI